MMAFFTGLAVALVLMIGSFVLFSNTDITSVERSSPSASVRLDDNASKMAQGSGHSQPADRRASAR